MFAIRGTIVFDTSLACGLYMTVGLPSDFETLSDELKSAVPERSAQNYQQNIKNI